MRIETQSEPMPKAYYEGYEAGKNNMPFDDTKSTTWKCGYDDGFNDRFYLALVGFYWA